MEDNNLNNNLKDDLTDDMKPLDNNQENLTETNSDNDVDNDINMDYIPRPDNGKLSSKNKQILLALLSITTVSACAFGGYKIATEISIEKERISEINTESLNLKMIIDTTDELGANQLQLNWKEITTIASVIHNNYTENITKEDIINIGSLFIDYNNQKVLNIEDVVKDLDLKKKQKERIFTYLDNLKYHGYTPDRLIPESPQSLFISSIKEGAIRSYEESKILPSITIAQAILESNWGNSNLTKTANNLFGIKADKHWRGEFVTFDTNEFHNTIIKDKFRKYPTLEDSIIDHSSFLTKNERYRDNGVFEAKTYKTQALALEEAGYSTAQDAEGNKTYAKMLGEIIRQYNLQLIDWEVTKKD